MVVDEKVKNVWPRITIQRTAKYFNTELLIGHETRSLDALQMISSDNRAFMMEVVLLALLVKDIGYDPVKTREKVEE